MDKDDKSYIYTARNRVGFLLSPGIGTGLYIEGCLVYLASTTRYHQITIGRGYGLGDSSLGLHRDVNRLKKPEKA